MRASCGRAHCCFVDRDRWKREGCGLDDYRTASTRLGGRRGACSQEAKDRLIQAVCGLCCAGCKSKKYHTVCAIDGVCLGCRRCNLVGHSLSPSMYVLQVGRQQSCSIALKYKFRRSMKCVTDRRSNAPTSIFSVSPRILNCTVEYP